MWPEKIVTSIDKYFVGFGRLVKVYPVCNRTPSRQIDRQDTIVRLSDICSVNLTVSYSGKNGKNCVFSFVLVNCGQFSLQSTHSITHFRLIECKCINCTILKCAHAPIISYFDAIRCNTAIAWMREKRFAFECKTLSHLYIPSWRRWRQIVFQIIS